jgi:uncharacterized iron-regulated membrane protein
MSGWKTWVRQPQTLWVRRAIFQVHLWLGIGLGLYIVMICLTGSVLVYRNELYAAFSPTRDNPAPFGFRVTAWLLELHDNLLNGETGRRTNGVFAALVILLTLTGTVVWWPGVQRWRRSLVIDRRANWKQFNWTLHSSLGFWFVAFILMWGITGLYLSYAAPFNAVVSYFYPEDAVTGAYDPVADTILFWLGYAHFGRFGGRLPGCGRGTCNEVFKAVWAAVGIVPVVMFVTGAIMWWNRIRLGDARKANDPPDAVAGVQRAG